MLTLYQESGATYHNPVQLWWAPSTQWLYKLTLWIYPLQLIYITGHDDPKHKSKNTAHLETMHSVREPFRYHMKTTFGTVFKILPFSI